MPSTIKIWTALNILGSVALCHAQSIYGDPKVEKKPPLPHLPIPLCTEGANLIKNLNDTPYSIYCGLDINPGPQHDLEVSFEANLEDCLIQCLKYNRAKIRRPSKICKGVVHNPDQSLCHLKHAFGNQVASSGRNSAFLFNSAPIGANCMQDDRAYFTEPTSKDVYKIHCKTELPGAELRSQINGTYLTDCMAACSKLGREEEHGCEDVTLRDGICTLWKRSFARSDSSPYAADSARLYQRNNDEMERPHFNDGVIW